MAQAVKARLQSESLVLSYMDRAGRIAITQLADGFGMSKTQLAETAGLARETLYRAERSGAQRTQGRLREMLEIISRVSEWAGGKEQAMAWYRAQPLPAFGGRTTMLRIEPSLREFLPTTSTIGRTKLFSMKPGVSS